MLRRAESPRCPGLPIGEYHGQVSIAADVAADVGAGGGEPLLLGAAPPAVRALGRRRLRRGHVNDGRRRQYLRHCEYLWRQRCGYRRRVGGRASTADHGQHRAGEHRRNSETKTAWHVRDGGTLPQPATRAARSGHAVGREVGEARAPARPLTHELTVRGAAAPPHPKWARHMRDDCRMLALLDLDGTLVDRDAGFDLWTRRFVENERLDAQALGWLKEADRAVKERGRFFALVREHFGTSRDADGLWDDYRAQMPLLTVALPGVINALADLRAGGWRLVVVSNGRVDNQLGKLRRTGILDLLDGCCVSEEIGIRKPDPAIFTIARERLGVLSSAPSWVVGDDPELDVAVGGPADSARSG
ncbi:MAG: HAD family hydrolase [Pseudonocardiales bacterium]|nr:HAD family hydrolase [Pseudonocardiales bacterium]